MSEKFYCDWWNEDFNWNQYFSKGSTLHACIIETWHQQRPLRLRSFELYV